MPAPRTPPLVISPGERARMHAVERLAAEGDTAALIDMLTDPSWAVRRGVVDALASRRDAAPALVRVIEQRRDDESRLAAAIDALATAPDADEAVTAMAASGDPSVVADAAQILGMRRSRAGVPTLVALTKHENENVAMAATEALGRIGGRSAVDSLVEAVQARQFFRTFPAIDVLSRTGDPRAIAPLAELVDDPRYGFEATRALGRTGDPLAVDALAPLLGRNSDTVIRLAALALRHLAERHAERVGPTDVIERALRAAVPLSAGRNLCRALPGAATPEQIGIAWVLGVLQTEDATPALTALLDGPKEVAQAATEALERIGREAVAQITQALREGDSATRSAILPALRTRLRSVDGVLACLDDPDPNVRASACQTLARAANPSVVPQLFEQLSDPDPRVVQAVTGAIQSLGTADTERLALAAARSDEPRVRSAAFRILSYFGYHSALPIFLDAVRGPDARLRDEAIHGLGFLDAPGSFEALAEAATHPEARARAAAMRALGHLHDCARAEPLLRQSIYDEDGWVRYYACQSLGRLGCVAAAPTIAGMLSDPAGQVRVAAVEALSHLDSPVALVALMRAARRSEDLDVRRAALIGLGIARSAEGVPLLVQAARSGDAATRLVAVSALAGFDDREALEQLDRAARDPERSLRVAAVGFLAARSDEEAVHRLIDLLADPRVEEQALRALSRFSPERVRVIVRALEHADEETAPRLTTALARMQVPEASAALHEVLSAGGAPARRAAAETLAGLGGREMIDALRQCATGDPDPEVRRVCAVSLARWQN